MFKANLDAMFVVGLRPRRVGEVAQLIRGLDRVISPINTATSKLDTYIHMTGIDQGCGSIKALNGFDIPIETGGLTRLADFRQAMELARASNPDEFALIETEGNFKYYVAGVKVTVRYLDDTRPQEGLFASVELY